MEAILILLTKSIVLGVLASVPLGPVGVLCIQRTLSRGRLSGFISGMGAAIADAFFAFAAIMGLSVIINFIEAQQVLMKAAGGAILLIIGLKIFFSNPVRSLRQNKVAGQNLVTDLFSVLVLMMTNPLAVFLFLAAFAGLELVGTNPGPLFSSIIVSGIFFGASLYWFTLSSVIYSFKERFRLRLLFRINKTAGLIIVFFGLLAVISILFNH